MVSPITNRSSIKRLLPQKTLADQVEKQQVQVSSLPANSLCNRMNGNALFSGTPNPAPIIAFKAIDSNNPNGEVTLEIISKGQQNLPNLNTIEEAFSEMPSNFGSWFNKCALASPTAGNLLTEVPINCLPPYFVVVTTKGYDQVSSADIGNGFVNLLCSNNPPSPSNGDSSHGLSSGEKAGIVIPSLVVGYFVLRSTSFYFPCIRKLSCCGIIYFYSKKQKFNFKMDEAFAKAQLYSKAQKNKMNWCEKSFTWKLKSFWNGTWSGTKMLWNGTKKLGEGCKKIPSYLIPSSYSGSYEMNYETFDSDEANAFPEADTSNEPFFDGEVNQYKENLIKVLKEIKNYPDDGKPKFKVYKDNCITKLKTKLEDYKLLDCIEILNNNNVGAQDNDQEAPDHNIVGVEDNDQEEQSTSTITTSTQQHSSPVNEQKDVYDTAFGN